MDYHNMLEDVVEQNRNDLYVELTGSYPLETPMHSPMNGIYDASPHVIEANYKRASFKYQ